MMHLKNLCRILMFVIATTICTGSESQDDIKVYFSTVPIHYKLNLIPNIEKDEFHDVKAINKHKSVSFDGDSIIIINILHLTSYIRLQKSNQRIMSAKLITRNDITYEMKSYIYYHKWKLLGIYFSDTLLPGFYTLKMEFIHTTDDNGKKKLLKRDFLKDLEGLFKNSYINKDGVIQ